MEGWLTGGLPWGTGERVLKLVLMFDDGVDVLVTLLFL